MECGEKYKKYDVVIATLPENDGSSEQAGTRPCIIIQNNIGNKYAPTLVVLPLSKKIKHLNMPTHLVIEKDKENGLERRSMLIAEQIKTVGRNKVKKIGQITDRELQKQIFRCYLYVAAYGCDDEDLQYLELK